MLEMESSLAVSSFLIGAIAFLLLTSDRMSKLDLPLTTIVPFWKKDVQVHGKPRAVYKDTRQTSSRYEYNRL